MGCVTVLEIVFVRQCEVFVCLDFVLFFLLAAKLIGLRMGCQFFKKCWFFIHLPLKPHSPSNQVMIRHSFTCSLPHRNIIQPFFPSTYFQLKHNLTNIFLPFSPTYAYEIIFSETMYFQLSYLSAHALVKISAYSFTVDAMLSLSLFSSFS